MKTKSYNLLVLLLALASFEAHAANAPVIVDPQLGDAWITASGGNIQASPLLGTYNGTTLLPIAVDANGNLVTSGGGGGGGGVAQQGALDATAQPWKQDLETYLGAAFSATNAPSCRMTNGTVFVDPAHDSTVAAIQTAQGAKTDAAATDSTSSWSVISILKGLYAKLGAVVIATNVPPNDIVVTGTMASTGSSVSESISGVSEGSISVVGTFSGGISLQCLYPGSVAVGLSVFQALPIGWSSTTPITAPGSYKFRGVAGCPTLQAVYASYVSGSVAVTLRATASTGNPVVSQPNSASLAAGSWYNSSGTQVQGSADGSGNVNMNVVNLSKGIAVPSLGQTVTSTGLTQITTSVYNSVNGVLNTDILTGGTGAGGWLDLSGYNSFYVTLYTTASTAGAITFEQTQDITNDPNGVVWNLQDASAPFASQSLLATTVLTLAASTVTHLQAPRNMRYVRFRISTAITAGSVGATIGLGQNMINNFTINTNALQAGGLQLGVVNGSGGASTQAILGMNAQGTRITALASGARTSSGTVTNTQNAGSSRTGLIAITAVGGTNPTLDVLYSCSPDAGVTYIDTWHSRRMTATGTEYMPLQVCNGREKWTYTIGGTATPTFTFSILTTAGSGVGPLTHQYYDRTANVLNGTISNATAWYDVAGCKAITAAVSLAAASVPGTYQLQLSSNGVDPYNASTATAAVANAVTPIPNTVQTIGNWARVNVTSGATGQTGNYVSISCAQ